MRTPARVVRALIDALPGGGRPPLEPREQKMLDRILDAGRTVFANQGRHTLSMADFAEGFGASPGTIRRYVCDLDNLLAMILHRHLRAIAGAMGAVAADAPEAQAARRAVYINATRTGLGGLTEAHLLMVRDRHLLPPDLAGNLEHHRATIGMMVGGDEWDATLHLLDHPGFSLEQIGAMLACPVPPPRPVEIAPEEKGPPFDDPDEELEYCAKLARRLRKKSCYDLYAQMPPADAPPFRDQEPVFESAAMALARDGPG